MALGMNPMRATADELFKQYGGFKRQTDAKDLQALVDAYTPVQVLDAMETAQEEAGKITLRTFLNSFEQWVCDDPVEAAAMCAARRGADLPFQYWEYMDTRDAMGVPRPGIEVAVFAAKTATEVWLDEFMAAIASPANRVRAVERDARGARRLPKTATEWLDAR